MNNYSLFVLKDKENGRTELKSSKSEKYLGDVSSVDGKNNKNIAERVAKGCGITKQIMQKLEDIVFGPFYFEVASIFRQSLFMNSILLNSEAWYNLKIKNIEELEKVDEALIRKILEAPKGTPICMLYLEMGFVPIRFLIMQRRLTFLHYILQQEPYSLVSRVLDAQMKNCKPWDWFNQIKKDLADLKINIHVEDIAFYSKDQFKDIVSEAVNALAFDYLIQQKAQKSKVKNVNHSVLEMQNYFSLSSELTTKEKKLLFSLRSKMLFVKDNYHTQFKDNLNCDLCITELDTQLNSMY